MDKLRQAFQQDAFLLDLPVNDIEEAIHLVAVHLSEKELLDSSQAARVEQELLRRERDFSTAIGNGVAVPHCYLEGIEQQHVVFVRLKRPINMGAPDGILTRFLFVLIGSPGKAVEHLDALTMIARLMADDEFRFDVRQAITQPSLMQALDRFLARTSPAAMKSIAPAGELAFSGRWGGGLIEDIRQRWSIYLSDFTDGLTPKTIGSTLFLFFACLAPTITFGGLTAAGTGGEIGAIEMLVATGLGGIFYSLLAGQPLIILGGTGPILIFTTLLYQQCQLLQIPFLPTYAWVGLWSALFTLILALTDASVLIRYLTRFTVEIFSGLISLIFIIEALRSLLDYAHDARTEKVSHDVAFLSLILGVGTFILAMMFSRIRRSRYLFRTSREFLADFGPTISVGIMMLAPLYFVGVTPELLDIPAQIQTTSGRPWLIPLFSAPVWVWWGAAIPAILVTLLIYLTHNITARLVNSHDHSLQKMPGYHLDLGVLSIILAICSLFGLPWLVAATVRSLNHVRSLATVEDKVVRGGETREEVIHVCETRLTGLAISLLICLSLLLLPLLKSVPVAVLYGLFLYMGAVSCRGNQFFERLMLWITDPELYPRTHYTRQVPRNIIHLFTLIQLVCLVILWGINLSPAGILFPLFITLLVPARLLLNRFFSLNHLAILDAAEAPEEEDSTWV